MSISDWLKVREFFGSPLTWILAGAGLLYKVTKDLPRFMELKGKVFIPISKWWLFRKYQRGAIRNCIQGRVNVAVGSLIPEMPEGSIRPLEIKYVNSSERDAFIREDKVFIRIRPVEDQDHNFISVIQLYLNLTLLPTSKQMLSESQRKSVTHFTAHKLVGNRKNLTRKLHNDYYLPDVRRLKEVEDYFGKIKAVDKRGLFFSIVLRAIEDSADKLMFSSGNLENEFSSILEHMCGFVGELKKKGEKNDAFWKYRGRGTSFSLLLVADPHKARFGRTKAYLKRFKDKLEETHYVFVVFSKAEWWPFGGNVAAAIEATGEGKLVETINSSSDYRGKKGGIIRVYTKEDSIPLSAGV